MQLLAITAEVRSEGILDGSDRHASWELAFVFVRWWGSTMLLDWTSTRKVGGWVGRWMDGSNISVLYF